MGNKSKNKSRKIPISQENRKVVQRAVKQEFKKELEFAKRVAIEQAVNACTAAFLMTISDEFEFGNKRLTRILEGVNKNFECILAGYVTIEDIMNWCKEKGLPFEQIFKAEALQNGQQEENN